MTLLDKFRLEGEVALVTGGASGIGRAMAEAVAEVGADVVIGDVDVEKSEEVASEIEEEMGVEALAVECDVSDKEEVDAMVERTVEEFGSLDVAFANAGIAELESDVSGYTRDQWERVIGINLNGVFYTDRAAAEVMLEQGGGSIINTASIYGLVGDNLMDAFAYPASKGGVVNLTRSMGAQLASEGVRVNAIAPAFVHTNLAGGAFDRDTDVDAFEKGQEVVRQKTPIGELAEPDDLKGMAVFLASEASSYCTGYTYAVDGGWLSV